MKSLKSLIITTCFLSSFIILKAQTPNPALVGYWQNWNDPSAPYFDLDKTYASYNIVQVSFAVPKSSTDMTMVFTPAYESPTAFISRIKNLQNQGRKVLISMGGANDPINLNTITKRDAYISSMTAIINQYGFDGFDVDFETTSIIVTGGTIANPTDANVINLIYALKKIMQDYYKANGKRLFLTMAPETAYVQGGMSSYAGSNNYGAYLPVIHAMRDSIEILHVQLYNSGSMYGIDGKIYNAGTADFITSMTEAVIQGFTTNGSGGKFLGLPANKVAVALPACNNGGGNFISATTVKTAMNYLMGKTTKPGTYKYTLKQTGGYPNLRGMMTWSVNWDAVATCATVNEYAKNFETIFGILPTAMEETTSKYATSFNVYPNPASEFIQLTNAVKSAPIYIVNALGEIVVTHSPLTETETIDIASLPNGIYFLKQGNTTSKLVKQK